MGVLKHSQLMAALGEFLSDGGCHVEPEHDASDYPVTVVYLHVHGPGPGRQWFIDCYFYEDDPDLVPSIVMASSTVWVSKSDNEMWKQSATSVSHRFSLAEPECFTKIRDIVLEGSDGECTS
jgi:hypothetical protein